MIASGMMLCRAGTTKQDEEGRSPILLRRIVDFTNNRWHYCMDAITWRGESRFIITFLNKWKYESKYDKCHY